MLLPSGDAVGGVWACCALDGPVRGAPKAATCESDGNGRKSASLPVTIIVPTLNAAKRLGRSLKSVESVHATVVVDGGSIDDTVGIATINGARVVTSKRGRGAQLAAGAQFAKTDWLLFLHADTVLEEGWQAEVETFTSAAANETRAAVFCFALDDRSPQARRLERLVRWRSRVLALPYGDQGLLIHRKLYDATGGYRPQAIMEDVDMVRRIGRSRLYHLESRAITSARRWQTDGWTVRSARNLLCLALYFVGVPTRLIVRVYGR
jgi:rSAM/selenodomain-associated transferase 2